MIRFNSRNSEYHLFNLLVFTFVALMMLVVKTELVSIKCVYAEIGEQCKTCGLTTSFKKALTGESNNIPFGHLLLFFVFVSQLLLRPMVSWLLENSKKIHVVRNMDIILFVILFSWTVKELLWEQ